MVFITRAAGNPDRPAVRPEPFASCLTSGGRRTADAPPRLLYPRFQPAPWCLRRSWPGWWLLHRRRRIRAGFANAKCVEVSAHYPVDLFQRGGALRQPCAFALIESEQLRGHGIASPTRHRRPNLSGRVDRFVHVRKRYPRRGDQFPHACQALSQFPDGRVSHDFTYRSTISSTVAIRSQKSTSAGDWPSLHAKAAPCRPLARAQPGSIVIVRHRQRTARACSQVWSKGSSSSSTAPQSRPRRR